MNTVLMNNCHQLGNLFWITDFFQLIKNIYFATNPPVFNLSFHLLYKKYCDYTVSEHIHLTFHLNYKKQITKVNQCITQLDYL